MVEDIDDIEDFDSQLAFEMVDELWKRSQIRRQEKGFDWQDAEVFGERLREMVIAHLDDPIWGLGRSHRVTI